MVKKLFKNVTLQVLNYFPIWCNVNFVSVFTALNNTKKAKNNDDDISYRFNGKNVKAMLEYIRCRENGKQCRPWTALPGAAHFGSTLLAQTCQSKTLYHYSVNTFIAVGVDRKIHLKGYCMVNLKSKFIQYRSLTKNQD